MNLWTYNTGFIRTHDEEEFARTGDVVVIKQMQKKGKTKSYYLRNVVEQIGKPDYWDMERDEFKLQVKEAAKEFHPDLKKQWKKDTQDRVFNIAELKAIRRSIKAKAIRQAINKLKGEKQEVSN